MLVILESTTRIVTCNGVDARVWEGETQAGVKVICLIAQVAVKEGQPPEIYKQFDEELQRHRKPSLDAFDIRFVL